MSNMAKSKIGRRPLLPNFKTVSGKGTFVFKKKKKRLI